MTTRSAVLRFELQMAEQSRKFGHRAKERREELERDEPGMWQHKHVVARMHEHGDTAINTNQLSRYESGNGPMPRDGRQAAFAYALKTEVGDLIAGPLIERVVPTKADLSDALKAAEPDDRLSLVETKLNEALELLHAHIAQTGTSSAEEDQGAEADDGMPGLDEALAP